MTCKFVRKLFISESDSFAPSTADVTGLEVLKCATRAGYFRSSGQNLNQQLRRQQQ